MQACSDGFFTVISVSDAACDNANSCPAQVGACGWRLGCINVKKWRGSTLLEQEQKIPDDIFVDEMNESESVHDNVSETNCGEGLHIQTPSYLVYAPAGHLPHVTLEVMKQHIRFKQIPIYQLSLPSIIRLIERGAINASGGIRDFCRIPANFLIHLTALDPLGKCSTGFNKKKSMAIWRSGGRKNVDTNELKSYLKIAKVDSFSTLFDYDVQSDCANKRLTKSNQRTLQFLQEILCNNQISALKFPSLGGGTSLFHRKDLAKEVAQLATVFNLPLNVVSIDFSMFSLNSGKLERGHDIVRTETDEEKKHASQAFNHIQMKELFEAQISELPPNTLRLVEGPFDPEQIFQLVKIGVDEFDNSYVTYLAERGRAFRLTKTYPEIDKRKKSESGEVLQCATECTKTSFFQIVDFNDPSLFDDFTPLFPGCQCYACTCFTRSYIYHLWRTREMLAEILLTIHNIIEFDDMFERIREYLQHHTPS